jgi:lipoprotein-anchoring transpeptidase ErfK/SrfK
VALLINSNRVVRTIAVSSGKPSTPTPPGSYRVYAKIARWWSVPFAASHGCVRQSTTVARWTYDFATVDNASQGDCKVLDPVREKFFAADGEIAAFSCR